MLQRGAAACWTAPLVLLGTLLAAGQAHARPARKLLLGVASLPADLGVSHVAVRGVLARAARAWRLPCLQDALRVGATVVPPVAARDGSNRLVVLRRRWCSSDPTITRCYDPAQSALTTVYRHRGRIVEADIELNAVYYRWRLPDGRVTAGPAEAPVRDLLSALLHELGHALGLAHPCALPGEPATPAVPACDDLPPDARGAMFPVQEDRAATAPAAEELRRLCATTR